MKSSTALLHFATSAVLMQYGSRTPPTRPIPKDVAAAAARNRRLHQRLKLQKQFRTATLEEEEVEDEGEYNQHRSLGEGQQRNKPATSTYRLPRGAALAAAINPYYLMNEKGYQKEQLRVVEQRKGASKNDPKDTKEVMVAASGETSPAHPSPDGAAGNPPIVLTRLPWIRRALWAGYTQAFYFLLFATPILLAYSAKNPGFLWDSSQVSGFRYRFKRHWYAWLGQDMPAPNERSSVRGYVDDF